MNNKLLLQDLTDQLADAGKLKKKDAEEFLRAFFKNAEDGLFEDGILKINGLGTLKLVLVEARKSVNVSTGEEFEIREHYKVSFIPDADLKNAVNQPYAHLEPVELDGGNESAAAARIEKKTVTAKEKPTKNAKSNEEMTQSEYTDSPKGPKKIKRSTIMWILFFIVIAVLGIWSWISNDQRRRENTVKINEIELVDSLEADAALQQDLAALAEESDTTGTKAADDSLEQLTTRWKLLFNPLHKNQVPQNQLQPKQVKNQPHPQSKRIRHLSSKQRRRQNLLSSQLFLPPNRLLPQTSKLDLPSNKLHLLHLKNWPLHR